MFKLLRKRIIKLKDGKGFTLTELIVVVALIAIMMASLMAFAHPVRQLLNGSTAKSDALTINEILGTFVERRLAYAHRVDVYTGVTYSNVGELKDKFDQVSAYASATDSKNRPGMLVFHYVKDDHDPLSSTFKIYDVQIKKLAGGGMPSASDLDNGDYLAFNDDFYGGYEFFMTGEDTKVRAYLNFRIQSYDFRGEYTDTGILPSDVSDYYSYLDSPTSDDPLYKFINEKTGSENISFALENVKVKTKSILDDKGTADDSDDEYIYDAQMDSGNWLTVTRGSAGVGGVPAGTDVVIFYNIKTYDVGYWKVNS